MTRMKRIYADFYHAFGAIGIRLTTKADSHEETIFDSASFVSWLLRGKKTLPQAKQNPRKSASSVSSALLLLSLWYDINGVRAKCPAL